MNEIERAIELVRDVDAFYLGGGCMEEKDVERIRSRILDCLRAELSRQENAPLTCDGCKWHPIKYDFLGCIISRCENCCRQTILTDRYEPKGEKECTTD